MERLRFYDFFAGVGMAEIGLRPAWECVWANDVDPKKAAVYRANHDPAPFRLDDVARVRASDLPAPVQMAWASFPCQDLSLAGWRRGMELGRRSGAFWEFHRLMRDLRDAEARPPLIVLENVAGLLTGPDFPALCAALAALDLRFGALVIDAKWFLPQSRPRVFVVALDNRFDPAPWEDDCPRHSLWTTKALWRAWDGLPESLRARWVWWRLAAPSAAPGRIEEVIDAEPAGVAWHSDAETGWLLSLMSPVNRAKVDAARRAPGRRIGFLYKRTRQDGQRAEVRFDGRAGCLRTATGGSSRQTVVIVENGVVRTRLLAPREAARLMGLGDDFALPPGYNDAYHAMGDGVAVPVVRWLGDHLLTPIAASLPAPGLAGERAAATRPVRATPLAAARSRSG
jgi:DNA (cytosine-5)-methyltransferase 1